VAGEPENIAYLSIWYENNIFAHIHATGWAGEGHADADRAAEDGFTMFWNLIKNQGLMIRGLPSIKPEV
jgi:hypothetical protein